MTAAEHGSEALSLPRDPGMANGVDGVVNWMEPPSKDVP